MICTGTIWDGSCERGGGVTPEASNMYVKVTTNVYSHFLSSTFHPIILLYSGSLQMEMFQVMSFMKAIFVLAA
jgi:hypothetical protein